jgi:hypothetical protein
MQLGPKRHPKKAQLPHESTTDPPSSSLKLASTAAHVLPVLPPESRSPPGPYTGGGRPCFSRSPRCRREAMPFLVLRSAVGSGPPCRRREAVAFVVAGAASGRQAATGSPRLRLEVVQFLASISGSPLVHAASPGSQVRSQVYWC